MKKYLLFFILSSCSLFNLKAQTPGCNSSAVLVTKMWEAWHDFVGDINTTLYNYQDYISKVPLIVNKWNQKVGNSWATIGPRSLKFNDSETGNIVGQTNRTFITIPSFDSTVSIRIRKTDGRAKCGVTICVSGENGSRQIIHSYTFESGNRLQTKNFILPNVKGKVISINMRNYSVGNTFKYRISAD